MLKKTKKKNDFIIQKLKKNTIEITNYNLHLISYFSLFFIGRNAYQYQNIIP